MKAIKYFVYLDGGDQYDWFDDEADAIVYAQKNGNKDTRIEKVEGELSDDGFDFDYDETNKTPVEFSMELPEEEPVEIDDEEFEMDFPDIPDVESSDDIDYDAMAKQYADDQLVDPYDSDEFDGHENFDVKEALDTLEENESEVECKNCFDLFPKEECIKADHGYLCKKCNQELHSPQGTNLDLIDANPKDLDYDDPRLPEKKEEPEAKEEPVDANEIRKHEAGIDEELKRKLNTESDVFDYYYNNWLDCDVDRDELYAMFEKGLSGKKFSAASLAKAYGWGSDYDYLDSAYKIGKDIHDKGLQNVIDEMAQDYALDNANDPNDQKELKTLKEDTDQKLKLYVIFNDGVEVGELVAFSEEDAIDRCYNGAFGSSTSDDMFSAELVEDPEQIAEYEKTWNKKIYNLEELAEREANWEDEDTFETLDELNAEARKVYHYSCDPSGIEGSIDATSEKEAQRKVEEILAGKGIYVPDEIITIDKGLTEDLKVITDFSSYEPWSGAVDTYELIKDADKLDELEAYLEELYPDGLELTKINDILWFDGEQVLRDLGIEDDDEDEDYEDDVEELPATKDESLEEHINDRPADIESDQENHGVDNAVVDCKKYTLVAHSEDEKPVDCKLEKPALEEPVAGEKVDVKLYEDEEEAKYAPFYYIYDYGSWYLYSAYENTDETNCVTVHHSNFFYEKKKYTGKTFSSLEEVIQDVLNNNELYLHLTDPDFMSFGGRRAGAIAAVKLNSKGNGWERSDMIFDRKGKKLVQVPVTESLTEAKKDEDELPPDPEVVKLEVHQELNNLVADEIEAIDGYEEVKADIIDKPIEHKDEIINTINHIEGEEKEHIDELVNVTTEIPFDREHKEEAPAPVEKPAVEEPLDQEFPEVEEALNETAADTPFDSDAKVGDSILIVNMEGEPDYCGRKGKVEHIDGIGQLHGTWGGCAVIPGVDKFDIITDESLKEEKAKPAGDKKADYETALKLAAAHNKPVIYGYSNKSYNGKYFTLDDPIVCDNVFDETKKFKQKYKSCGTAYVAYPDDYEGLKESYRFSPKEQEKYNCDEDGCYEDNGHWGRLVKCNWCGEFYDNSECKFEADFGWLCDRCQNELYSHGGPLTFIEPGPRSCDEEDELEANLHNKD